MHMLCLITYKVRSENGYGFLRPGLKTGKENSIFWSEIGSGFGNAGGTSPPPRPNIKKERYRNKVVLGVKFNQQRPGCIFGSYTRPQNLP